MERLCKNCAFYFFRQGEGLCRRYPPEGPNWSEVTDDDWCGEFWPLAMKLPEAGAK